GISGAGAFHDAANERQLRRRAASSALQVDDVDAARAIGQPAVDELERVMALRDGSRVVALLEAHRPTVEQVDSADQLHQSSAPDAKAARIARPPRPLFSGWNCTPLSGPERSTDGKRKPSTSVVLATVARSSGSSQ